MAEMDRIRWHCRRGLLELDLLLERFLQEGFATLPDCERDDFVRLLDTDDNQLWDWVGGRADPEDAGFARVVRRLREVRLNG